LRPALAWIIGRGGFLGSRVEAVLPHELPDAVCWAPNARFSWRDPDVLSRELNHAIESFAAEVRRRDASWLVLWCAGAGGIGTSTQALETATRAFCQLVDGLGRHLAEPEPGRQGTLLLSSSAGGVYGDNPQVPLTEDSRCCPISEYGENKLRQEGFLLRWTSAHPNVSCLIARPSNLYGPGQDLARSQGLIAQLSRNLVHHRPTHIYVPLDTLRDYLFVDDAARSILRDLGRIHQARPSVRLIKIFAAEQSISIAGIIGIFARIIKRPPLIVCSPNPQSRQQPGRLQFRSLHKLDANASSPTKDLGTGIHAVLQHHIALYQQGRLPTPTRL
jgi:UDP-glucose 4-epimerase